MAGFHKTYLRELTTGMGTVLADGKCATVGGSGKLCTGEFDLDKIKVCHLF